MKLKIDEKVQERIKSHMKNASDQLILDLDDGVGSYSSIGNCALGITFKLLVVNDKNLDPIYNQQVESPLGTILMKDYTVSYLEESPRLTLNNYGLIKLTCEAGTVDENVVIVDYPEVVAAAKTSSRT